ncbi:hypothetical protein ABZV77_19105 [Streptomyces sp. NPDC004732]|uniref:hypothetical protein n=1 Tax=Streptomyces sp. NPDC004732 TaxID=3154290 RepID=UPI0033A9C16F
MMLSADRMERLRAQLGTARRHIDTARSRVGRVATAAGAAAATTGLFTPDLLGESLLATAAATGTGLLFLPTHRAARYTEVKEHHQFHNGSSTITRREPSHQARTTALLYTAPGASLTGLLLAEQLVPGIHWGEVLAVSLWSAGIWWLRPARTARHMLVPPPPTKQTSDLAVTDQPHSHPVARWWAENAATEEGAAPGTVLQDIEQTGEQAMRAVIHSITPGEPVPDISLKRLSALMDVPVELINIGPAPGRGASVQLLTVGKADEQEPDAATVWAERIAPLAMPEATLTAINFGSMTRKEVDA